MHEWLRILRGGADGILGERRKGSAAHSGANDFAGPFIGAGAWGHFSQKLGASRLSAALDVRYGSLRLDRLELTPPAEKAATSSVTLAGKPVPHRVELLEGRLAIVLSQSLTLSPGKILEVIA